MKRWLGMVALLSAAAGVLVMMLPTMELRWALPLNWDSTRR